MRLKPVLPVKIVVPLVLGIIVSLAIAIYSELGYRRLESANRQVSVALEMQALLKEALALIADAEAGQRGYLLTRKQGYLDPYKTAVPRIEGALKRLRELLVAYGTPAQRDAAGRLDKLVGKRLAELEAAIELDRTDGPEAAQALIETDLGRRSMDEIRVEVENLAASHRQLFDDATRRWAADVAFARLGMQVMTAFTVALLLVVWLLARRDAQQRDARRRSVQEDNRRLEALVEERTAALSELSNHLQTVREDEKSKLARDIHDELGGILVGAKMDVAWVEKRVRPRDPDAADKLARAQQALDDGVAIKRRIIEELRPTLLDNLGLSAALDWQVHEICDRAGLECTIAAPADDSRIAPDVAIALYRIVQEALTNVVKYAKAKRVSVDLGLGADTLTMLIEDDGVGIPDSAHDNRLSHGITGMRQRVRALHGDFSIGRRAAGGTVIEINIPYERPSSDEGSAADDPGPSAAAAQRAGERSDGNGA